MPFNKPLPEWKNPGVKPNQGLIDAGWKPDDKPPADVHNWWMNTSYVALEQLQNEAINKDQIGVANGVAPLGDDGKVPASMVSGNTAEIETQLENHINNDLGHVRFLGGSSGQNAMTVTATMDIPVVNDTVPNPVPKTGVAFRFFKITTNSGAVQLQINYNNGKNSLSYPVVDAQSKALTSGALVNGGMYTVAFNGTAFFLQGSGSGVVNAARGNQTFNVPGSHTFVVPDGVSLITCYLFGGGGGGGGGGKLDGSGGNFSGGGGGGGAFALRMLQVTPGTNLTVYVGAGGNGGNPGNNGTSGLYSYVTYISPVGGSKSYFAYGGGGGGGGNLTPGNGGGGGTPTMSGSGNSVTNPIDGALVGPFLIGLELQAYSGGSGGSTGSITATGGGGGSSPSDIAPGKAANSSTGGIIGISNRLSVSGGNGGNGGNANSYAARDGDAPGGGGGGGAGYGSAAYMRGGKGGDGRVILVW